ncbi:protein adenylyltransferase SelO [Paracoccus aerodenitrificans]|uniref:protein adenylyltransferase SelO n=1 Tax=Paracoccus aerodenitrificans TaxID=3017781 RepID=UPI0022F05800|nr:YdiU family protein [Paracoccus aerodenitrificans]WBU65161.1 YdiU family protein [Paracoccus aerodenitrificans]
MNAPIFDNSYTALPPRMFAQVAPEGSTDPQLIALNLDLADRLGLDGDWLAGPEGLAMLSGNALPRGAASIAQAYAGHQFGHLSPQLGDGRAVMIGEIVAPDGARFDLQLKGAGRTPFSRQGDGKSWLGPVLREYLDSEFMAAAGVPTTRALAAIATGDMVYRETILPGAVMTRVASSHVRVGTFEYFGVRGDIEALRALTDHIIARHYPDAADVSELLEQVVGAQAGLVAQWMALGFIHGVMNTDNMAISGETIDYGPAAFMDGYHPDTKFSSIDLHGRYAWAEQPHVAVWNLAQFASCLIPLMGADQDKAIERATRAVHGFPDLYQAAWKKRFCAKLGLPASDAAVGLVNRLLDLMAKERADFTIVFAGLSDGTARDAFIDTGAFDLWRDDWRSSGPDPEIMARANPLRIPRNHRIEQAIQAAVGGDYRPFHRLDAALRHPFEMREEWADLSKPPLEAERVTRTFCGT